MTKSLDPAQPTGASVIERPLIEDIRLLGQILGDTMREQEGEEIFERIETIRRLASPSSAADPEAGREARRPAARPDVGETVSVIRAFSYFSHLANIAEDRHFLRRRAALAGRAASATRAAASPRRFERLARRGVAPEAIAEALARIL